MRSSFLVFIVLILILISGKGYGDSVYVSPSFYYTYGDYSNKLHSNSFAFYNTLQLSDRFYLINSYDNLKISSQDSIRWDYTQQMMSAGLFGNYFPYYIKFTYSHIKGDFKLKDYDFGSYSDYSNLFNFDFMYYQNLFYYGISYTFINSHGILTIDSLSKQSAHQLNLKLEYIIHPQIYLSIKPNYSKIEDGRNLLSTAFKIHYLPLPELLIKAGGFAGERAYYFDPDLLTIFNQNDTQKLQLFGTLEYFPTYLLKLAVSFQHTKFTGYSVNYYTAGVKLNLNF